MVQFSDHASTVIGLSPNAADILAAVTGLQQMKESTNTRAGFIEAKSILDTSGRPGHQPRATRCGVASYELEVAS